MELQYKPFEKSGEVDELGRQLERIEHQNVGNPERLASVIGGAALAAYGLSRKSVPGVLVGLIGGALMYRGATGHCDVYEALNVSTGPGAGGAGVPGDKGTKVEQTVIIGRPPEELFAFWRNLENLPRFMRHLESVTVLDERRSRWKAKAPLGRSVEWEAEIINEHPNEMIAWRSLPGAEVQNAGSVRFNPVPGGTEVRVSLEYNPPAGIVGATIARLFGESPEQQIHDDLQQLKSVIEGANTV
jgi:uncharacterized membrane protein